MNKKVFYPITEPDLTNLEREALIDAFDTGWISSIGSYINLFEENFAKFCNTKYAVAVSNGTSALHLALISLGVGEGDEVIIPSLTFVATAAAVVHCGATPVFVDSEELYGTICTSAVEKAVTSKTKAIIAVHLYGHPAEMDTINSIAEKKSLFVIEDAAEAHGAKYKNRLVGGIGDVGTFSFYGNKMITTGEGGMVTTNDEEVSNRVKYFRDHAMDSNKRYWHTEVGYNYRMTNLQAAIGTAQLSRIKEIVNKKINILKYYKEKVNSNFEFQPPKTHSEPVPWLISVVISKFCNLKREVLLDKLRENGIDTRPFFIPIHQMPPYSGYRVVDLQNNSRDMVCNHLSKSGFNLPSATKLNFSDLDYIIDVINKNS